MPPALKEKKRELLKDYLENPPRQTGKERNLQSWPETSKCVLQNFRLGTPLWQLPSPNQ
jgi:hypothetical protein